MSSSVLAGFVSDFQTEYRLFRQVTTLAARGFSVTIAGYGDPHAPPRLTHWADFKTLTLSVSRSKLSGPLFFLVFMWKLFWTALRSKPDIYLACDLPVLIPFALAQLITGGKLIYDSREIYTELPDVYQSPIKRLFWKFGERMAVKRAHRIIAVCEGDREFLVSHYPGIQTEVVRNTPPFSPKIKSNALRKQLGISPETPVILFLGSLLKSGGVAELVDSIPLTKKGHLVILGTGPEQGHISHRISQSPEKKRISLLPPVPFTQVHPLVCSADLGVVLTKNEGISYQNVLPNKLFEYAQAGLPMVLSNLPEIRKIHQQFDVGKLVSEILPETIAEALDALMKHPEKISYFRENALALGKKMCWENEEAAFLNCFQP